MMMFIIISARNQRSKGDGEYGHLNEEAERHDSRGAHGHSLMMTPCTKSLGCESGVHKGGGDEGLMLGWKFATVSWSGAGGLRC